MRQTRLWLLRHAPVRLKYIYGQQDVDADLQQPLAFDWLRQRLPETPFVLSSDLSRCVKTVQQLGYDEFEVSSTVREQHFGNWQGLTYDQARATNVSSYDAFWQSPATSRPPEGESFEDVYNRVQGFLEEEGARHKHEPDLLLSTHAGVIRAAIAYFLQIPLENALSIKIEPLSLTRITLYHSDNTTTAQVDWVNRAPPLI